MSIPFHWMVDVRWLFHLAYIRCRYRLWRFGHVWREAWWKGSGIGDLTHKVNEVKDEPGEEPKQAYRNWMTNGSGCWWKLNEILWPPLYLCRSRWQKRMSKWYRLRIIPLFFFFGSIFVLDLDLCTCARNLQEESSNFFLVLTLLNQIGMTIARREVIPKSWIAFRLFECGVIEFEVKKCQDDQKGKKEESKGRKVQVR